ncbi:MAG: NAD(+)/NADH kinase [Bacteroidales bacterium]|nr:NAD(+)/NADH kinase [Bacteroidales bacterium]MBQ9175099.1 NAD(+)/NADH kinase [Bacteroidales bacterium]MBQ9712494.1 NAD(+)/NADH kinase [Bacteroidales bacterium]MBR1434942.1 NAD(+)/NADH kinase [Bacteroidales bacterium]
MDRKIGIFVKNPALREDGRTVALLSSLREGGCELYDIVSKDDVKADSTMVLSVGGDGTFLSAAKRVAPIGIPILGVNLGRIGFLSENSPETVAEAILSGEYSVEDRSMLYSSIHGGDIVLNEGFWPYALNEVTVHRIGSSVLGIHVTLDGTPLPTYWADGLLVATSSGSTAYSLSVGGPICMPESKVLIIAPIAPHNLNVRPLIVPDSSRVSISVETRDPKVVMSMDNRNLDMSPSWSLEVSMAQFSLKRIRLAKSNFVKALTSKLFWGEDIRNNG